MNVVLECNCLHCGFQFLCDMAEDELRLLRERVASLEAELASLRPQGVVVRQRIDEMSSEVVDTNPYSRLMALKRMGIVDDYQVLLHGKLPDKNFITLFTEN